MNPREYHLHVFMAVVTGPIGSLLITSSKLDQDFEVLKLKNLRSALLFRVSTQLVLLEAYIIFLTSSTCSGSPLTRSFSSGVPSVGMKETFVFSGTISGTSLTPWPGSEMRA